MRTTSILFALLLFPSSLLAAESLETLPATEDAVAIYAAEKTWANALESHDLERLVAVYTDGAILLPPGQALIKGKDAIRAFYRGALADEGFAINRQPGAVELSDNMAYLVGNYRRYRGAKSSEPSERGSYVSIWEKQPDGTWRIALDAWNRGSTNGK